MTGATIPGQFAKEPSHWARGWETLFLCVPHLMDVRKVINWGGVQQAETPLVTPDYLIFRAHVTLS